MGQYDIDKEVYKNWLEEKVKLVEAMTTREEIESRIVEISKIEFFAKREWALLHQQYDKITGRKGIAPWLKAERDSLITDPNIKVDFDNEPRKKEKKPKSNNLQELLGINIGDLTKELKNKSANGTKEEKKVALGDFMSQLASAGLSKTEAKPKATEQEVQDKAAALKEKMRLAKEAAIAKK
jgi:hypothetical protein